MQRSSRLSFPPQAQRVWAWLGGGAASSSVSKGKITASRAEGAQSLPQWVLEFGLPPWWAHRAQHQVKEDCSQLVLFNRACLARFKTYLGLTTLFYFLISFFQNVYLCLSHHYIVKAHNLIGLTLQVHSWRRILPHNELYLESHPYLNQMLFR